MSQNRTVRICVFCGSRHGSNPSYTEAAKEIAREIATRKMELVFGAGNLGLMGEVSREALRLDVPVTGIIPTLLLGQEPPESKLTVLHIVKDMHERKAMMQELSEAFVCLPGGVGTLEEAFEMVTGNWLGIANKPVAFLNVDGFYDNLIAFLRDANATGFVPDPCLARMIFSDNVHELFEKILEAANSPILPTNAEVGHD